MYQALIYFRPPPKLGRVIPEHKDNPHFQVNRSADILRMDYKIEKAKVDEAQASKPAVAAKLTSVVKTAAVEQTKAVLPGSQSTKKAPVKGPARPKSSMFMPTKRPAMAAGRGGRQIPVSSLFATGGGNEKVTANYDTLQLTSN